MKQAQEVLDVAIRRQSQVPSTPPRLVGSFAGPGNLFGFAETHGEDWRPTDISQGWRQLDRPRWRCIVDPWLQLLNGPETAKRC